MELGNGPRARTRARAKASTRSRIRACPPGQAMPIHFMDGIHCQGHRKPRAELQQRQRQQVSPSPPSNPAPPLHSLREVRCCMAQRGTGCYDHLRSWAEYLTVLYL
jgi:hypothetical protein